MKRLIGVTLFGILFIVFGVLGFLGANILPGVLQKSSMQEGVSQETQAQTQEGVNLISQQRVPILITSLAALLAGIGLLMLQGWAQWLTLILAGVSTIQGLVGFFGGSKAAWTIVDIFSLVVFTLGWNGFIVWYFLRPSVKAQFQKQG